MPANSDLGADTLGQNLYDTLGDGDEFILPNVDLSGEAYQLPSKTGNPLYDEVTRLTNAALTEAVVDGAGTFDVLMTSHKAHLREEYEAGRITGDQYAKAYMALVGNAMQGAVQYLLGKDQAYWNAILVQAQARKAEVEAVTAAVQLEASKAQLAMLNFQAKAAEGQVALVKMQLANEDAKYSIQNAQITVLEEQAEAKRAETLDTRSDGTTVAGAIGKQKELYDQQIDSYQKDATYKVGKMFSDGWITQKTLDEGLTAPVNYTNEEIDEVLSALRAGVGLGAI